MKILCTVEVVNRTLPTLSLKSKKGVKSSLTIGKTAGSVFLLLQTNQNLYGNRYKILNNVQKVFTKFINEGKATIRFKVPEHDLAIKCDPIQLKGFLKTLKSCLDGIPTNQLSTVDSSSVQTKALKPVKKKMVINVHEDYPVLEGFPRTLESLVINNCCRKTLDTRILRLRNLQVLNLEANSLMTLPEQLGASLPHLTELYLNNNQLGLGRDWRWIVNSNLQNQLRLLDLQRNNISVLPDRIVKLKNLVTLKLDNNTIDVLPNAMGLMGHLRYFSASNNTLCYVPRGLFDLKLESVDLSRNPYDLDLARRKAPESPHGVSFSVPSLLDSAAATVINYKLPYLPGTLPLTLIDHLESVSFCVCGKACFSTQPVSYICTAKNGPAWKCVISSSDLGYIIAVRYCSTYCYSCLGR